MPQPGRLRPTARGKRRAEAAVVLPVAPSGERTGCGAAWLARCVRDAEVPGSNPGSPTLKVVCGSGAGTQKDGGRDTDMPTSGSQKEKTPSQLIDARVKELDDWRGTTLSTLRGL